MKATSTSSKRIAARLSQDLDKHFAACCAAAAGAAYLAAPSGANAQLVYSGVQNIPVFPGNTNAPVHNGGVYIDFELPPLNFAQGARPAGWDINPYSAALSLYFGRPSSGVVLSGANAANLAAGTSVSGVSTFSGAFGGGTVGFYGGVNIASGSTGFIGFKFDPDSVPGVQTWYGWMRISVGSDNSPFANGVVVDWAYDQSGAGVQAGVVPEPSTIALLAMGAGGVLALRRRRASTTL